jgi:hypothetical protein
MKRTVLVTLIAMTIMPAAFAGHKVRVPRPVVAVCLSNPPAPNYAVSRTVASVIFAHIGIELAWHDTRHCPADALQITMAENTPPGVGPGVLAYALPYEGTHIVVFLSRIQNSVSKDLEPVLLGHVFAHEITHILQGCTHHSDSGLMKAHWTAGDYGRMARQSLSFTLEDIDLIHDGMAHRSASRAAKQYDSETEGLGDGQ